MKKSQTPKRMNKLAPLAALLFAAATSTSALAHEEQAVPFTMAIILDGTHGTKVQAGKYEKAIDRITKSGSRTPSNFADQINLCVAYAKTNDLLKAGTACEAAIAKVRKLDSRMARIRNDRNLEVLAYRSDLALALSNRGVLMAAAGDTERAKQDFLAAIDLQTKDSWIFENNLERVNQEAAS